MPDEKIVDCTPDGKNELMDFSGLEIAMESDDDFYFNGTVKFLRPIDPPWKVKAVGERFIRDQWVPGVEKKISDYCDFMKKDVNPMKPILKDQKDCPLKAGVSWILCI